ncbi:flagellar motor protein MotD [Pseudomaricurvus sp.]|uniref:flagellar motor protein MotD n=1 Tax=Pseudomaricurvus sp. TaxID=2004510 RepID=UPI003F6CE35E
MPRRRPQEDIKHERWLVSYSDFITLLFAFFVVMYSISQVNEGKYRVLSNTLNSAFELSSGKENVPLTLKPIQIGQPEKSLRPNVIAENITESGSSDYEVETEDASPQQAGLNDLSELFEEEFSELINQELVQIHGNEFWLEVELKSSILFDSADAEPSFQAKNIFEEMAGLLRDYGNEVRVAGFTDNVPIATSRFPSNWELSSARAVTVVKLLAASGVAPERLSAVGYGAFHPIAENDSEEGRSANRRVTLLIARDGRESNDSVTGKRGSTDNGRNVNESPNVDSDESTTAGSVETSEEDSKIEPVELGGGGWLFSSNPELPRLQN